MTHDLRYRQLRKHCSAYLNHFGIFQRGTKLLKFLRTFFIIEFYPSATRARPWELFGYPLHGNSRKVTQYFGQSNGFVAVVSDVLVDFVGDQEQVEFFGNRNESLQHFPWINHSCGVVRVDDQDSDDTW